ncbi:hypothetical protein HGM15179_008582 [Zosterops borbonicus]|uniref:Uncharacterized protein n=1 Tax=Zosterops borbonicus TaxID=364589 RepID=A0A8K1LLT3_9PASS|nr:hypothetical protein HGM15179_008582 [Zosterops borbonicus]
MGQEGLLDMIAWFQVLPFKPGDKFSHSNGKRRGLLYLARLVMEHGQGLRALAEAGDSLEEDVEGTQGMGVMAQHCSQCLDQPDQLLLCAVCAPLCDVRMEKGLEGKLRAFGLSSLEEIERWPHCS